MTVFFCSDTHFDHKNVIKFTLDDGFTPMRRIIDKTTGAVRPFYSVEEMNEHIIENWNRVVSPQDKVYHLGDFSFGKNPTTIGKRLNGHKRLVRGNHDGNKLKEYAAIFEEVYGVRHLPGCVLSHVPLHPDCLERWGLNIHGHLHANRVKKLVYPQLGFYLDHPTEVEDRRYLNVAVEQINYTPISAEEISKLTGRKIL